MSAAGVEHVSRTYPGRRRTPERRALVDFSLRLDPGEFVALLGPNGAGKSTLMRLLAGLDRPDTGTVSVPPRGKIAAVFQSPALDPLLTVRENLRLQAALYGTGADQVDAAAARHGLTDRLDDRVGTLSGGLARRADLARALLTEPTLLLLDEPTAGLDHEARAVFLDTLDAYRTSSPALSIVMSTHLMDEASRATRVVLMDRGTILADGAPAELRRELGDGSLLRTAPDAAPLLERYTLRTTLSPAGLTASGDPQAVSAAAEALLRAGVPFELAPPTLGDVYLARAGRALTGDSP